MLNNTEIAKIIIRIKFKKCYSKILKRNIKILYYSIMKKVTMYLQRHNFTRGKKIHNYEKYCLRLIRLGDLPVIFAFVADDLSTFWLSCFRLSP